MHIPVDAILVRRLSRIANRISGLDTLAISTGRGEYNTRPTRMALMVRSTR
ncbi:MAG: hypothetical protein A4E42_02076 [Methanoregulaceae archaeon PtaU1.Bin222]|nr:MAG: hypothetical protein A4E42_02076 [Methanoregulaceae archaeon PtaU1.Bin222]